MINYHPKFIIIEMLKNLQSSTVKNKCKNIFSRFGTPKELVTDNGSEFTSHYFKLFSRTWNLKLFSPTKWISRYAIKTVKRTLKKAKLANEDHYLSILSLNFHPGETGLSPAHKLFNCPIHTNVPSVKTQPKPSTSKTASESEIQNQLPTLKPGDTIKIRANKEETWDKIGSVIAPNNHPHSYILKQ